MTLEAYVLGTSGSLPLPYRSLTSVLLRHDGKAILFDCGEGMQTALKSLQLRWKQLDLVVISHSHADHVTGLPGLLMLSSQVKRETPLRIICPPEVKQFIEATIRTLGIYINYEIVYTLLNTTATKQDNTPAPHTTLVHQDKHFSIECFCGVHTRDVWGFVFKEHPRPGKFFLEKAIAQKVPRGVLWSQLQRGQSVVLEDGRTIDPRQVCGPVRAGRKVVYLTDTRPIPEFSQVFSNSDLVLCEGMFLREHQQAAEEKKHMAGYEAAELLAHADGVRQAGLLHFSPRYTKRNILQIEEEAKAIFPRVFSCTDKLYIDIPFT